ncbi:MAG TPA: potassium transporter Kef [Elusimicrobia bacterium]|nr:MAG: potassium transporter Kef [Elusimicrobia bacterium GWF2_62_30]HBA62148.1 potassium transporter Kef [Elusimicrobiota bacterium]
MGHSLNILTDIGLGIIFAAGASHLARVLRQPLILGYVLGGILLGTHLGFGLISDEASIEIISEMGLILLLFIIGLEINLRDLMRMGKTMFTLGLVQFAACVILALGFFKAFGYANGGGKFDLLYLAVALALSSTLVVVKLLNDKFETSTLAGRLTIGILVLQDIWAIIFMAFQPNLLNPELGGILRSFGQGLVLVVIAFLASKFILARLFHAAGKFPELVLLSSTAWCFFICGLAEQAGLSKEMGALIAGMSIAAFPYGTDVISKLTGVRDFFVTLFFVALGLKVPQPSWSVLGMSFVIAGFVVFSRLLSLVPTARLLKTGVRTGFLTAINLSQISEFSLVILALGAGYKHITPELQSLVLTSMLLMSVLSTYLIHFNDRLARWGLGLVSRLGLKDSEDTTVESEAGGEVRDIVILGCFREGMALLDVIDKEAADIKPRVLVVDYNPAIREQLEARGYKLAYGDLAHPQTLHHLGIEKASIVICTISDTFLKGITNLRLLAHLKEMAPEARFIMTADEPVEAGNLRSAGAQDTVLPSVLTGAHMLRLIKTG